MQGQHHDRDDGHPEAHPCHSQPSITDRARPAFRRSVHAGSFARPLGVIPVRLTDSFRFTKTCQFAPKPMPGGAQPDPAVPALASDGIS